MELFKCTPVWCNRVFAVLAVGAMTRFRLAATDTLSSKHLMFPFYQKVLSCAAIKIIKLPYYFGAVETFSSGFVPEHLHSVTA